MPSSTPVEQQKAVTTVQYSPDNYNEDLMNYTMVDNVDVYYYLSSEEDFGE
jgi:ribosomal protein L30E